MPETVDYSEMCDYYSLKRRVGDVLRKYYSQDNTGGPNQARARDYSAEQAVEDIHDIIGEI